MTARLTPFAHVQGPYYVYELQCWIGTDLVPIYIGRGKGRRAKYYYQLKRPGGYLSPKTHNAALNRIVSHVRRNGYEISVVAHDCGTSKSAAQRLERELVGRYGRLDRGTGTLTNRNGGG